MSMEIDSYGHNYACTHVRYSKPCSSMVTVYYSKMLKVLSYLML